MLCRPIGFTDYTRRWAEEQFGKEHAAEIAEMLTAYTKFNARRKPLPVCSRHHAITLVLEQLGQVNHQRVFVVDKEDRFHGESPSPAREDSP